MRRGGGGVLMSCMAEAVGRRGEGGGAPAKRDQPRKQCEGLEQLVERGRGGAGGVNVCTKIAPQRRLKAPVCGVLHPLST